MIYKLASHWLTAVNVILAVVCFDILFTSHSFVYEHRHIIIPSIIANGVLSGIVLLVGTWRKS